MADLQIAVGFFDGVHLGHQAILKGADAALTFENHPLSILAPDRAPRLIMSWEERAKAIMALGIKVTALEFDANLAARSPEAFLELLRGLAAPFPLAVRCGANWRFGKNGAGDADWLRAHGVPVTIVPYVDYRGEAVSSTRIRRALAAGELKAVEAMLGKAYALCARKVRGKGLGRTLGFATVNFELLSPGLQLPPYGVYAARVAGAPAIANFGFAPTLGERAWARPILEVHFLGGAGAPAMAEVAAIELKEFIRPERKFANLSELSAQISADIAKLNAT